MKKLILAVVILCGLATFVASQTSVSVMLVPIVQYLNTNGAPLANGCLFSYAAGTNNAQALYSDSLGTVQLPNPVIMNGSGYPTNASGGITTVYVTNQSYKFVLKSAGGSSCSTGTQIYSADNVQGFLGIQNLANTWGQQQTFSQPIIVTPTALQFVVGAPGQQTTLNFPQPAGNITLNFPSVADTIMGKASTCSPNTAGQYLRDNGTQLVCAALVASDAQTTYVNEVVTGTFLNRLAQLTGTGTVNFPGTATTSGVIGICVSNCGTTGSAQIASSGILSCTFDGATTANDYVQISSTFSGFCHDSGVAAPNFPSNGNQVVGRVLSTNGGSGTYAMQYFGPEIKAPSPPAGVQVAATANLTAQSGNVGSTPLITPAANGFYRASCYLVETQAATTSSTLPACQINWTDADSNSGASVVMTATNGGNAVGVLGLTPAVNAAFPYFYAKSGTSISYQTINYASSGATVMQYAIHVRLEGPL
jgi:hypothetical protein